MCRRPPDPRRGAQDPYGQGPPDDGGGGMSTGVKVMLGVLVAAVLGLGAALAIVSGDDGDETTPSTTSSTTASSTTSSTSSTTSTSTATEPTTTATTTQPPTSTSTETTTGTTSTVTDLGTITDGSGGTPAP